MKKLLLSLLLFLGAAAVAQAQEPATMGPTDFTNSNNTAYTAQRTYTSDITGISYKIGAYINGGKFQQNKSKGCFFEIVDNPNGYTIDKVELLDDSGAATSYFTGKASDEHLEVKVSSAGSGTGSISGGTTISYNDQAGYFEPDNLYFSYFVTSSAKSFTFSGIRITYQAAGDTRKEVVLQYEPDELVIHLGEDFTQPKLVAYVDDEPNEEALAEILYSSDNEALLGVDADGNMTFSNNVNDITGPAVITAKLDENSTKFRSFTTASFTLHVVDPSDPTETIDIIADDYENAEIVSDITDNLVTISFAQGSASTPATYYSAGTSIRLYSGAQMTISVPDGFALESVSTTNTGNAVTPSYGTMTTSNTWVAPAGDTRNSVTFTVGSTPGKYRELKSFVVRYEHLEASVAGFEHNVHMYGNSAKLYYTIYINHHCDAEVYEVDFKVDGVSHKTTEHQISVVEAPQGAMMRVSPSNSTTHIASGSIEAADINTTGASKEHQIEVTVAHNGEVLDAHTYTTTETSDGTTVIEEVAADAAAAAEYFTLQGVRVAEPQAGNIYLVRRAGKVVKQLVK